MPTDEKALEAEITSKGLNAPRLTPDHIDRAIIGEAFHVFPGTTLTVCVLTLRNGFTVTGESAAASPANFDETIGRKIAHENARQKIWALEGYLLRQRLSEGPLPVDLIASVCHEVNRALCTAFGDLSQKPWMEAEPWQRDSAVKGVEFAIRNPDGPVSAQHDAWSTDKIADGWTYGEVKDPSAKKHPCLVPFNDLSPEQKAKDYLFKAVVRALTEG